MKTTFINTRSLGDLTSSTGNLISSTLEDNNIPIFYTVRHSHIKKKYAIIISTMAICAGN